MRKKSFQRLVSLLGREAAIRLAQTFGGRSIYIPKLDGDLYKAARNNDIYRKYKKGATLKSLSKEYHIAPITVANILVAKRKEYGDDIRRLVKID